MKDVIIIGGGASGIVAAIHLADICKNARITILEKNERIGKKLLTTGNGKCNITNTNARQIFTTALTKPAFTQFGYQSTLDFFKSVSLYVKSDESGRCYPLSESAKNVLNLFLSALQKRKVEIKTNFEVTSIQSHGKRFLIRGKEALEADAVILAIGSAASVKGYNGIDLMHNLGLRFPKPAPALCPIPSKEAFLKELKGVRAKGSITLGERTQSGEIQFNENSISGICAFNLAKYVKEQDKLYLNFNSTSIPEKELFEMIQANTERVAENAALLDFLLLRRLGLVLIKAAGLKPSASPTELSESDIWKLVSLINAFGVGVSKPTEYRNAQTVCGGINESLLEPETMQLKKYKGIFCCGELLDADAPCGGFNLQWAWSSGLCAAESVKKYLEKTID